MARGRPRRFFSRSPIFAPPWFGPQSQSAGLWPEILDCAQRAQWRSVELRGGADLPGICGLSVLFLGTNWTCRRAPTNCSRVSTTRFGEASGRPSVTV